MRRSSAVVAVLVVLTCGGLFIWGTTRARQVAALTACTNNLRQTALALDNHHDAHKYYPAAVTPNSRIENEVPLEQRFSWIFDISHYMDARMDPKWRIDPSKPYDAPENRHIFESYAFAALCPANPNTGEPKLQRTHYVAIAGIGKDAITLPESNERSGFMGFTRIITKGAMKDGLAGTMTVVETARDNGHWAKAGWSTVRGLDFDNHPYLGESGQFNSYHHGFSMHVTNAAFADCSVRRLTSRIAPQTLEALATIAGGEKVDLEAFP